MTTNRRIIEQAGPDFYPTPPWATRALMNYVLFDGDIWEPACGDGAMAQVIQSYGNKVYASDLNDHGFGVREFDFLLARGSEQVDNIVTNPPYNLAEEFLLKSLEVARYKVALLLRLAFLEGAHRASTIFKNTPPAHVLVFSERITFYKKGAEVAGSGTTAYAWFIWEKPNTGRTDLTWIEPGFKAKYGAPR